MKIVESRQTTANPIAMVTPDNKVNIFNNQKKKIKNALHSGAQSVTIKLKPEDIGGNDFIAVTKTQFNKLRKAREEGKAATIKTSKTQIRYNIKIQGCSKKVSC